MENRFEWGTMQVHIDSKKGIITSVKIFSDSLHPNMVQDLQSNLLGTTYDQEGIKKACTKTKNLQEKNPQLIPHIEEFTTWLTNNL